MQYDQAFQNNFQYILVKKLQLFINQQYNKENHI